MNSIKNRIRAEHSNPGPGAQPSVRIPTPINNNNNKEINNNQIHIIKIQNNDKIPIIIKI